MKHPFAAYRGDKPYIFVSYAHENEATVYPEMQWLREQGVNIWYDEGVSPGHDWHEELARKMRESKLILFFASPESTHSVHCRKEVNFALDAGVDCLVVHLESTEMPDGLKLSLADLQAILKFKLPEDEYRTNLLASILARVGKPEPPELIARVDPQIGLKRFAILGIGFVFIATVIAIRYWPDPLDEIMKKPVADQSALLIDVSKPVPGFSNRAAIAVLPFVNISNDPEQEYFADGITEDLITGLQSFQSFPIIARTSTFKYKGRSEDVREIAAVLGAGYVIEGSVRKVGDDVRINVQLNNHQGQQVWARNYDFKFEEVLRIQAELVSKIMLAIEPELIITEADRVRFVRTEDMEAFDYYLRAATNTYATFAFTDLNGQVVSPERLELAREFATKAVALDPNFAAGWRLLNHIDGSYVVNANLAYLLSAEEMRATLERAIETGERSRQLSPFEPSVCSCLAVMLLISGDVEGALLLQEESLKQNPASAVVHAVMAKILQVSGNDERALKEIKLAKRLSPEDMAMTTFLYFEAAIYQDLSRFEEAVAAARMSLLLSSVNYDSEYVKITSLYASGEQQLARTALAELKARTPSDFQPVSGYDEPFPQSITDNVKLASGASLQGLRYNEGLRLVLEDLGWRTE